jgi:DNA-binding response OmpR family regulator
MLIEISPRGRSVDFVKRTALIVEDDPRLQRAMRVQLGRLDFTVLVANHYDAAVCHLATREPQLACVDVGLPNKSGYELCEHIRGSMGLVGLPILMTSEFGTPEDMAYAEDAGGNAFLRKPFSMRQLADCVESMLDAPRWNAAPVRDLKPLARKVISSVSMERPEYAHFPWREHTSAA